MISGSYLATKSLAMVYKASEKGLANIGTNFFITPSNTVTGAALIATVSAIAAVGLWDGLTIFNKNNVKNSAEKKTEEIKKEINKSFE